MITTFICASTIMPCRLAIHTRGGKRWLQLGLFWVSYASLMQNRRCPLRSFLGTDWQDLLQALQLLCSPYLNDSWCNIGSNCWNFITASVSTPLFAKVGIYTSEETLLNPMFSWDCARIGLMLVQQMHGPDWQNFFLPNKQ